MLHDFRKRRKPTPTAAVRRILHWRDGGKCVYCGDAVPINGFHADHFVPYSHGGKTHINNLVLACPPCNMSKSYHRWRMKYPPSPFRRLVAAILYVRHVRIVDFL